MKKYVYQCIAKLLDKLAVETTKDKDSVIIKVSFPIIILLLLLHIWWEVAW